MGITNLADIFSQDFYYQAMNAYCKNSRIKPSEWGQLVELVASARTDN